MFMKTKQGGECNVTTKYIHVLFFSINVKLNIIKKGTVGIDFISFGKYPEIWDLTFFLERVCPH